VTSYGQTRLYDYGFTPITISQLGFTPGQITTALMSFGVPLPESESEFLSYPHYPQRFSLALARPLGPLGCNLPNIAQRHALP